MAATYAQLGKLVEIVGVVDALRLVENRGGIVVYVPHPSQVQAHSKIAQEVSLEAARKLAAEYPGTHLMVPMGAAYLRRERDKAILEDFKTMSASAIARKYETTERNVYRVLERGPEGLPSVSGVPESQGDLFGENAG